MSPIYLDTSALVKRYITEAGSDWVRTVLEDRDRTVFTSLLTIIEAACTFARRRREGMLSADDHRQVLTVFDYDLAYHYAVLDVKPEVIDAARQLADRHPLRAYDAVHLATAWLLKQDSVDSDDPPLTFVCSDERLTAIAQAEGLTTENPNDHP